MTLRPYALEHSNVLNEQDRDYVCPHCGRHQVIVGLRWRFGSGDIVVKQCLTCKGVRIDGLVRRYNPSGSDHIEEFEFYPGRMPRPWVAFVYVPEEVLIAYHEACRLFGLHVGAAGAYARRALELVLDTAGYTRPTLAASIEVAGKEPDGDKRLPKRLLSKLDYVKEIGNFALHVRRDGELAIVEIDSDEVEACLEIVEELVTFMFEEPGRDRTRTIALNGKLKAAGKREIALPPERIVSDVSDARAGQQALPAPE